MNWFCLVSSGSPLAKGGRLDPDVPFCLADLGTVIISGGSDYVRLNTLILTSLPFLHLGYEENHRDWS